MEQTHKIEITIKHTHEFTAEEINDLVCTALEGGINYWCGKAKKNRNDDGTFKGIAKEDECMINFASDLIGYGGSLTLYDAESDDTWELDLPKMLKGIVMYCETNNIAPSELMDIQDADVADVIVQYALFGEIVFN